MWSRAARRRSDPSFQTKSTGWRRDSAGYVELDLGIAGTSSSRDPASTRTGSSSVCMPWTTSSPVATARRRPERWLRGFLAADMLHDCRTLAQMLVGRGLAAARNEPEGRVDRRYDRPMNVRSAAEPRPAPPLPRRCPQSSNSWTSTFRSGLLLLQLSSEGQSGGAVDATVFMRRARCPATLVLVADFVLKRACGCGSPSANWKRRCATSAKCCGYPRPLWRRS